MLSKEQILALAIIAEDRREAILKADIEQLLAMSYITPKFGGGWMVNGKGREALRKHARLHGIRPAGRPPVKFMR